MLFFPSYLPIGVKTLIKSGRPSPAGLLGSPPASTSASGPLLCFSGSRAKLPDVHGLCQKRVPQNCARNKCQPVPVPRSPWPGPRFTRRTSRGRSRGLTSSCCKEAYFSMSIEKNVFWWEAMSLEPICQAMDCRGPIGVNRYQTQPSGHIRVGQLHLQKFLFDAKKFSTEVSSTDVSFFFSSMIFPRCAVFRLSSSNSEILSEWPSVRTAYC